MSKSLHLYRDLHRTAARLPVCPVQRKLKYNIRQLFDLYRSDQSTAKLTVLHADAKAAIEVIQWFNHLPKVTASLYYMPALQPFCKQTFCTQLACLHKADNMSQLLDNAVAG